MEVSTCMKDKIVDNTDSAGAFGDAFAEAMLREARRSSSAGVGRFITAKAVDAIHDGTCPGCDVLASSGGRHERND